MKNYKWSMFTFHVNTENGVIINNTLNHGVIFLDRKTYNNVLQDRKDYQKELKELLEQEFIVPENTDEKSLFIESLLKEWNECGFLDLHILTTTGCNFKCPYCYQCGISAEYLTEEKMRKEIEFLENYIKKNWKNTKNRTLFVQYWLDGLTRNRIYKR